MRIGIDISQLAYGTGVGNYLQNLVENLTELHTEDEFVLFFSSFRRTLPRNFLSKISREKHVTLRVLKFPPLFLDLLWNRLHIIPIEWFIGQVDLFISSDWTEPPVRNAKKATIIYDLIVYKYPEETADIIVQTQKRKLSWTKKESDIIFCISEATKRDVNEILKIDDKKLTVLYPGVTL